MQIVDNAPKPKRSESKYPFDTLERRQGAFIPCDWVDTVRNEVELEKLVKSVRQALFRWKKYNVLTKKKISVHKIANGKSMGYQADSGVLIRRDK